MLESGNLAHSRFEAEERARACIRLIALHHPTPLRRRHCASARVSQQVDEHVLSLHKEQVIACYHKRRFAFLAGDVTNRLDGFNTEWFDYRVEMNLNALTQ